MKKLIIMLLSLFITAIVFAQPTSPGSDMDSGCHTVMPVKFNTVTVSVDSRIVKVYWQTDEEINNNHFEVQRSTDGHNYTVLKAIKPSYIREYTTYDTLINNSNLYYRIKQVDNDGGYSYSKTVFIRSNFKSYTVNVYPTLFSDKLNISCYSQSRADIMYVLYRNGQLVLSNKLNIAAGTLFFNVATDTLKTGSYVMAVYIDGQLNKSFKLIKAQ